MSPKIIGCCSKCDVEVFDIEKRDPETRLPTQTGAPHANAVRSTFVLMDGTKMDLTFCAECNAGLTPQDYPWLWQRVLASWIAESSTSHPCVKQQAPNGIFALSYSQPWRDVRG